MYNKNMSRQAFTPIAAGQTINQDIDIAEFYDLSDDTYNISTDGFLPYAEENSTQLGGNSLRFRSNELSIVVDGVKARQTTKAVDRLTVKRVALEADCSTSQRSALAAANTKCASMALAAAQAATSSSAKMFEQYFRDNSSSTRSTVATHYQNVAKDCSSTGGPTTSYCSDTYGYCSGDLLAYTIWQNTGKAANSGRIGTIYHCPRYFNDLLAVPTQCHEQSQATNALHEETHAVAGTVDVAYGFSGISKLSSSQAIQNADTYALFANGEQRLNPDRPNEGVLTMRTDIALNCGGNSSPADDGFSSYF